MLVDGRGRQVDYHLVDLATTRLAADGNEVYGPRGLPYDVGGLDGTGQVAGHDVACCKAAFQVNAHGQGYQPDDDDHGDVLALHQRFGTPLLPPYDTWRPTSGVAGRSRRRRP